MPEVKTIEQRAMWWLLNGETGISSKTICSVMLGQAEPDRKDARWTYRVPGDPDDFSRCHALLELIPEWRAELHRVAKVFPEWTGLVERWDELEGLYAVELKYGTAPLLYKRMQELIDAHQPKAKE